MNMPPGFIQSREVYGPDGVLRSKKWEKTVAGQVTASVEIVLFPNGEPTVRIECLGDVPSTLSAVITADLRAFLIQRGAAIDSISVFPILDEGEQHTDNPKGGESI